MDIDRGLLILRKYLEHISLDTLAEYTVLEERLITNRSNERLFGGDETSRKEKAQIIFELNRLSLAHCNISFNELCMGETPSLIDVTSRPLNNSAISISKDNKHVSPRIPLDTNESLPMRSVLSQSKYPSIVLKLHITQTSATQLELHLLESPKGEWRGSVNVPYSPDELIAILKSLQDSAAAANSLTEQQSTTLNHFGLMHEGQLVSNLHERVGKRLYDTIMIDEVQIAFQMALTQARIGRGIVTLQLRFDEEAVDIARYPWELLHDGRRPLLTGQSVELSRYISYPEATTHLSVSPPLRVLYLAPRPVGLSPLPNDADREQVHQALSTLERTGILHITDLIPPTFDALLEYLEEQDVHILHFDGHGTFARACPRCATRNYPHLTVCDRCGTSMTHSAPEGYLAFEHNDQSVHWVRTKRLETILRPPLRIAVLLACLSGVVRGETLFTGVAPALIQAGIPAVVATQLAISTEGATAFTRGFYRSLARFESVTAAVNAGRRRLETHERFIPVVYLRSQDDTGYLFGSKEG